MILIFTFDSTNQRIVDRISLDLLISAHKILHHFIFEEVLMKCVIKHQFFNKVADFKFDHIEKNFCIDL